MLLSDLRFGTGQSCSFLFVMGTGKNPKWYNHIINYKINNTILISKLFQSVARSVIARSLVETTASYLQIAKC